MDTNRTLGYPGYPAPQARYSVPPPGGYAGAGPGAFPVQSYPGGRTESPWMPAPSRPLNCPPGLEYLIQIDHILVYQQIELLEVISGFETANKYKIKDSHGQKVYYAVEYTNCCNRNCCGACRPFTMRIFDNIGQEVLTMKRPLRCTMCCFPCCLQQIEIQAPPGVPVGYVSQIWHPCVPKFTVQNEAREDVLKITGPFIMCSCFADIDFEITSLDEQIVIGKISKHWSGFVKELLTDADVFGIQFPLDLDVKMKAVMLGACFLIDFMFFEVSTGPKQNLRIG